MTLDVVRASALAPRRVRYAWLHYVPIGAITLMAGEEGVGKTTVGIDVIAKTTRGTLPGENRGHPRNVIVLAFEDGLEDVIRPRLEAHDADLDRVLIVRAKLLWSDEDEADVRVEVILPRDLDDLGAAVREHDAAFVWIDSLVTTLPDDLKSISYKDVAKVLRRISTWAADVGVAVVAPWHLNKGTGSDTAHRIMDSRAFRTAVRSMLLVVPDPDAPEGQTQAILALDKANAGTLHVPGLRYRIDSHPYEVDELDPVTGHTSTVVGSCGRVTWLGEVSGDARSIARAALDPPKAQAEPRTRTWLRELLIAEGEMARSDILARGEIAVPPHSESAIKRAAAALRVNSREAVLYNATTGTPIRNAMWSLPTTVGSPPP